MPPAPIRVALLWHMHQPYYLDPVTGESVLPWVRLHALKHYWGMVRRVETTPGMRCTFNLVPSLVEQVEAYAAEHEYAQRGHHEIYLGDPFRAAPEKLRTIFRHPVVAMRH